MSMDNPGAPTTVSTAGPQMIPHLHFTRGDSLWLLQITPSSKGAVAGACIFLVALAIFERFYSGWSGRLKARWSRSARTLMNQYPPSPASNDKSNSGISISSGPSRTFARTIPPFIFSHDIPRGVLFMGHALLRYMLMLAVMTYSASYIISILIGLSIGEVAYGRLAHESLVGF